RLYMTRATHGSTRDSTCCVHWFAFCQRIPCPPLKRFVTIGAGEKLCLSATNLPEEQALSNNALFPGEADAFCCAFACVCCLSRRLPAADARACGARSRRRPSTHSGHRRHTP